MITERTREPIEYYNGCRRIFEHYGVFSQKLQFIQELAELIQALTKDNDQNFVEELADVQIMIDQFTIKNPALDAKCKQIQIKKVNRQLNRIIKEKKNGRFTN